MTDQPITVPPDKVAAIRKTLAMIQDDARDDAARTEGLALTGRNVGELFGNVLASISALAGIIDTILETDDAPHVVPEYAGTGGEQ